MLKISILDMNLKLTNSRLQPHLTGAIELILQVMVLYPYVTQISADALVLNSANEYMSSYYFDYKYIYIYKHVFVGN